MACSCTPGSKGAGKRQSLPISIRAFFAKLPIKLSFWIAVSAGIAPLASAPIFPKDFTASSRWRSHPDCNNRLFYKPGDRAEASECRTASVRI
jgi:hypothetical protein